MVQVLLDGLRADPRFEVHHVDARVSDDMEDIGSFRSQKFIRLFKCILQAWWIRLRHGRMAFYYVPAPAKRSAIMRDWVVIALCRPIFPKMVFHWHAYGLGDWSAAGNGLPQRLTRLLLRNAALSIVTTKHNRRDAELLSPRSVVVIPNGLADPCPDFDVNVFPARSSRSAQRCLFLAHCTEEKGLFDALEAFAYAKHKVWRDSKERLEMTVAGSFVCANERLRFLQRIGAPDLAHEDGASAVNAVGFLDSVGKDKAFRDHDCLVFPSHWESFGLTVVEAASYGMPSVISEHPNLVSLLPGELCFAGPCGSSSALGESILRALHFREFSGLRAYFSRHYLASSFAERIGNALASV